MSWKASVKAHLEQERQKKVEDLKHWEDGVTVMERHPSTGEWVDITTKLVAEAREAISIYDQILADYDE
jgi:hypothetical protein